MDFEFDYNQDTVSNDGSITSASSNSRRGGVPLNRKRQRQRDQANQDEDSSSLVSLERVSRVSVNPDAGTYQMLRDDCLDLCSTIQSRNPSKALEAAVELALLISNRKTRSILWQGDKDSLETEENDDNFTPDSWWSQRQGKNFTVLQSILDLIVTAASTKTSKSVRVGRKTASTDSPLRSNRTKSARRKQKEKQQGSTVSSVASMAQSVVSNEMKLVVAIIFYFLSWDCTMSDQYSVASMGLIKAPYMARKIRLSILKHGEALQGVMRLFLLNQQHLNTSPWDLDSVSSSTSSQASTKRGKFTSTRSEWRSQSSSTSSLSSVSFNDDALIPKKAKKKAGDPTASGRLKRRKKRRLDSKPLHPIPETDLDWPNTQILPSAKVNADLSYASEDEHTFTKPQSPTKRKDTSVLETNSSDLSVASSVTSDISSTTAVKISPKFETLLSKVILNQTKASYGHHDSKWISMVCLESLNRLVTGKDEDSPSCMEDDEERQEDPDESAEDNNPILVTNNLLGKSGIVPLLARAMSEALDAVSGMILEDKVHLDVSSLDSLSHWHDRISILASLIDGACLFHKANRRAFCEDDPFSFEEQNQGLIFHLLVLLSHVCQKDKMQTYGNGKLSGIMLLGLRTLTSLTHENELAADQLTMCKNSSDTEALPIRGLEILTELVFKLERRGEDTKIDLSRTSSRTSDEDLHRYDSTIFCLNTLANIIEGPDVRRILAEIKVDSSSGKILWLTWLCKWLITQTESFHDAVLDGTSSSTQTASQRELQKHEEDKLLAAGNGCVLLACLMKEPERISEEPESTNIIRKMIVEQMPVNQDGKSTGVTMIINTLKAFCNFYRYSLGDLCFAVVTPVKTLITELQELTERGEIK